MFAANTRPSASPWRILACMLGLGLTFLTADVSAQALEAPRANASPERAQPPSLAGPRFELVTGAALIHASIAVGFLTAFYMGPSLFACGDLGLFDNTPSDPEEEERCEREARAQTREATHWGAGIGGAIAAVGTVLTIHGAIRLKHRKRARRLAALQPSVWNFTPSPVQTSASVGWRF
ncbi:MAG: hypothetical protein QM778_02450 [Myxococcales bacterium]